MNSLARILSYGRLGLFILCQHETLDLDPTSQGGRSCVRYWGNWMPIDTNRYCFQ